ncbi:HNH endonuclease [Fusobacterium mortiferum]|uniref:HNH endonuclease n=1 Tax=Fusobacterium mortiferum TaxID=850 RepID=A0ABS2G5D7_FUSMR|nr:HNH endonuclease [Fusobacterium mortiferum]MBM6875783.1 HNH endonuclease [Fusobacterium mortiferum]
MAKSKWETHVKDKLILVEGWARNGLTDEQIAKNLGISTDTFYRYKKEYSDFSESLKKGKEIIDFEVENALLKRALGYTYEEITEELIKDTGQKARHQEAQALQEKDWEMSKAYFNGKCAYCGAEEELTKDHVIPLSAGGKLELKNIIPACVSCNSSKKDKEWVEWFRGQKFYSKEKETKIREYLRFVSNLKNEKLELTVTKKVTKHMPGDTTAQIFWLKNRKPEVWRDKTAIEHSGEIKTNNPFSGLTTDELKELIKNGK